MRCKRMANLILILFVFSAVFFTACSGTKKTEELTTDVEVIGDRADAEPADGEDAQEESYSDLDSWKPLIGASTLLNRVCDKEYDGLLVTVEKIQAGDLDEIEDRSQVLEAYLVISALETAMATWQLPEELAEYKEQIITDIDGISLLIGQFFDGEMAAEEFYLALPDHCDNISNTQEEILAAAAEAGLSETDIELLITEMELSLAESMDEIFDDGELEEDPSLSKEVGFSRENPYPLSGMISAPHWDVEITEIVREEEAWKAIKSANQFNQPAPEGYEYLLLNLHVISTYEDDEIHWITSDDFDVTGSYQAIYSRAYAEAPEPVFDGEVSAGGEVSGWAAYMIRDDETDLMLIVDELVNGKDDRFRFIAIDEGASVSPLTGFGGIEPSSVGTSRTDPAPLGETVTTEDWEIQLLEVIRGDDAWVFIDEGNQFNDPPGEGMEFIAVLVKVRKIGSTNRSGYISSYEFTSTGSANIIHDPTYVIEPPPVLEVNLYPGGEYQGWVVVQGEIGEENMTLIYEPDFDFSGANTRYLSLEE